MSLNEDYENRKEQKEKRKTRKEKLSGYFFDLSKLTFAALVLGGLSPLLSDKSTANDWIFAGIGLYTTYIFAKFANTLLK